MSGGRASGKSINAKPVVQERQSHLQVNDGTEGWKTSRDDQSRLGEGKEARREMKEEAFADE